MSLEIDTKIVLSIFIKKKYFFNQNIFFLSKINKIKINFHEINIKCKNDRFWEIK